MQADSVQITISVPAPLAEPGAGDRARLLLVLDAVRSERLTWRAGARALGLAPSAFLDLAKEHGVPVLRPSESDVAHDLATLERLDRARGAVAADGFRGPAGPRGGALALLLEGRRWRPGSAAA